MRPDGDDALPPGDEREDDTAELTAADDEWPVPSEYRAAPPPVAPAEPAPVAPAEQAPPAPPGAGPPPAAAAPRRFPPTVAPGLLALALLLIVGGLVLAFALRDDPAAGERAGRNGTNPTTTPPTTTTSTQTTDTETTATVSVPDLSGISVEDARERLAERGLEARVREVEAEQPAGEIVRQTPDPGREVQRDTTVVLLVSSGPPRVEVPGVIGLSRGRAESELREAGLVADVRTSTSSGRPGTVLEQSPAAGSRVDPESRVRLVVAVKPEPQRVRVPRIVGLPVADARARLRDAGLRSTVTRVESTRESGTVVRQSPPAGSSLREGQAVSLEVSSGPALVTVPDVVGLDEASARQELQAAGFSVRVVEEETSEPSQDGLVVAQRPLGGSSARSGAAVTITVAVFV
jgi:beta-lactam-binding protein with PASTA domain